MKAIYIRTRKHTGSQKQATVAAVVQIDIQRQGRKYENLQYLCQNTSEYVEKVTENAKLIH